jgi:hypothetical protein
LIRALENQTTITRKFCGYEDGLVKGAGGLGLNIGLYRRLLKFLYELAFLKIS